MTPNERLSLILELCEHELKPLRDLNHLECLKAAILEQLRACQREALQPYVSEKTFDDYQFDLIRVRKRKR